MSNDWHRDLLSLSGSSEQNYVPTSPSFGSGRQLTPMPSHRGPSGSVELQEKLRGGMKGNSGRKQSGGKNAGDGKKRSGSKNRDGSKKAFC